jgi:D-alanine-D-alanine ligase
MTGKRGCILYNKPRENALADELDVINQAEYIESNLRELGIETYRSGITLDFINEIAALANNRPDFVFNLVESINNKGELCYFVPALLNMYSIPYSGSPVEAIFITTNKSLTSKTLKNAEIGSPATYLPSQYDQLIPGKKYIIKPIWEDGSIGITGDSVFTYIPGFEVKLNSHSDRHWLIQDYIDGREFNISMIYGEQGPEVMPPAEMTFQNYSEDKPKIVDFKAKWEEGSFEYKNTVRKFPGESLDPVLGERIKTVALRCWNEFGLKGYARVDMRIDHNNVPYVIEVNANPCLSPGSGFVAAIEAAGLPFTEVIKRILSDLNN